MKCYPNKPSWARTCACVALHELIEGQFTSWVWQVSLQQRRWIISWSVSFSCHHLQAWWESRAWGSVLSMRYSAQVDDLCSNMLQSRESCLCSICTSNSDFVLVIHVFLSFWTCLQSQQDNVSLIFYLCLRGGVLNHFCIGKRRSPKT